MIQQLLSVIMQHVFGVQQAVLGESIAERSLHLLKSCIFYLLSGLFFSVSFINGLFEVCKQWETSVYSYSGPLLASSILGGLGFTLILVPILSKRFKTVNATVPQIKSVSSPLAQAIERLTVALINRWTEQLENPKEEPSV